MNQPRTVCSRCIRLAGGMPLAIGWHALWRHGWRHFCDVLFEINRSSDPAAFVAALLAAGVVLTIVVYAVAGAAAHRVLDLFR